ncbi:growth arrest-specific protein 6 [Aplysia californica]|uniref:Growth arrest-specific protein 6 n=1 Tax=Aplysia californica TaxID=6500 RepID=A0ABM1A2B2_APLCA|nr:growth arrest-specific protein 6 [Aplysia californica]
MPQHIRVILFYTHFASDIDECAVSNGGCSQVCDNQPGTFRCLCNSGYTLASDSIACNDIDECAFSNGGCSQVCDNQPGTFRCLCNSGYTLASDSIACDGE